MNTQQFKVANVKCGGCAATIKTGLLALGDVEAVEVDVASGQVQVTGSVLREILVTKLAELGHPEVA